MVWCAAREIACIVGSEEANTWMVWCAAREIACIVGSEEANTWMVWCVAREIACIVGSEEANTWNGVMWWAAREITHIVGSQGSNPERTLCMVNLPHIATGILDLLISTQLQGSCYHFMTILLFQYLIASFPLVYMYIYTNIWVLMNWQKYERIYRANNEASCYIKLS